MERTFQPPLQSYSQGLTSSSASAVDFSYLFRDESNVVLTSSSSSLNNVKQEASNNTNHNTNKYSSNNNGNNSLEPPPAKSRKICSDEFTDGDDEDGTLCLICFTPYESSGDHRVACLTCGHIFGLSCISTWLAKGTMENVATCPTCSCPAKQDDIRILYTKAITAVDTTDRDKALRKLELAQNSKYQAELEIEMLKIVTQTKDEEIRRLKAQLIQQQQSSGQLQFPKTPMNPAIFQTNSNSSIPVGNFASSTPARPQAIIWSGSLEWHEKAKGTNEPQNTHRIIPCQVSTNILNGLPELKSDGWPSKLRLQLIPKSVLAKLGGAYFRDVKTAFFNFQACDSLTNLTRMMESGFAACVHIAGMENKKCSTKVMILMFIKERHSYLGFIPNDQAGFVDQIRNVIQQQKTQALLRQVSGPSTSNSVSSSSSGGGSSSSLSSSSNPSTVVNQFVELPTRPTVLQQPQSAQQSIQQSMQQQQQQLIEQQIGHRNLIKIQAIHKTLQNNAQAHEFRHHHHLQQQQQQQQQNLWPPSFTMPTNSNNGNNNTNFTLQQPSRNFPRYNFLSSPLQHPQTLTHPSQIQAPEVVLLD